MTSAAPLTLPTQRLGWSVFKSPMFKTRQQESVSGRLLRIVDQPYAKYEWRLTWEILADGRGALQELRTLMGFFTLMQGKAGTFLYNDPTDNSVMGQVLGTGDGTTTTFAAVRQLSSGGLADPIVCANTTGFHVYLNGALQGSGYTLLLTYTGLAYAVQFTSAPAGGVVVSADFSYLWPCHFSDDVEEFENFAYQLWALKELKFESLLGLPPT